MDMSGSMHSWGQETIQGYNTYIQSLKDDKVSKYMFSLTLFNTTFKHWHIAVPIEQVPDLTTATYIPNNGTALYDAIGVTVEQSEKYKADKHLVVIMTDGEENSSAKFNGDQIRSLIAKKEKEGNWTFVYLGASLNAYATGVQLGVSAGNAYNYKPNQTAAVYAAMSMGTQSMARGQSTNTACFVPNEINKALGSHSGSVSGGIGGQSLRASVKSNLTDEEVEEIKKKFSLKQSK
jgi:hypothetical protein